MKSRRNVMTILVVLFIVMSLCSGDIEEDAQYCLQTIAKPISSPFLILQILILIIQWLYFATIFIQKEIRHDHGKNKSNNHYSGNLGNSKLSREQKQEGGEEKSSYTPSELLKEQYEVKKKFKQLCDSFELSDNGQWPVSEIDTSQYAQKLFAFNLRDPKDIYDIIINKKEIDTLYWTQIIGKLQPWAIMIVVCLIGQCICCCQIFCIPELKIFRRCCQIDFNQETQSNWEKNIYFFLIVIFGGLIFFVGGCVFMASDIEITQNQLQCTILWSQKVILGVDAHSPTTASSIYIDSDGITRYQVSPPLPPPSDGETLSNSSNTTWVANYGGIDVIKYQFKELSHFFQRFDDLESVNQIKDIKVAPLYDEFKQVSQIIPQFYEKHRGKTLDDPNSLDGTNEIVSEFIESIGPLNTRGTIGQQLVQELEIRKLKIDFVDELEKHTIHLENVSDAISSSATKASAEIDNITYLANTQLNKLTSFINYYTPFVNSGVIFIEKYFQVVMFIVFCGLIGFIFVAWPKFNTCAVLLHLSWYCSTCVLIVGFALCLGMFSIGLVLNNGVCRAGESFLTDPNFLKEEGVVIPQKIKDNINYCVFQKEENFEEVQTYLKEIEQLELAIDAFQNLNMSKQSLNSKINYSQNVLINEKYAANSPATEAIKNMNDWTDYSLNSSQQSSRGSCNVSRDQWIWSDSECTYSTIIQSTQSDFDLGFTVCLQIIKSTESFVSQRYTQKEFHSCKVEVGQEIIKRFNAIQRYRESVQDVFKSVLKDLNEYNTSVDKLDIDIDKISGKLKNLNSELNSMFNVVTSQNGGLRKTLDCSFVKDSLIRTKNAVCISGLNGVLLYTVFFLASSITLIFFSLFVCISAARILPNKDEEIQKQMMQSTLNQNSSFVINSQRAPYNPNESVYRKDQRRDSNNSNEFIYYKSNVQKNNNGIFSDQENNIQLANLQPIHQQFNKESDNSFIKQTKTQLRDIHEDDNDSSYHSANNHL